MTAKSWLVAAPIGPRAAALRQAQVAQPKKWGYNLIVLIMESFTAASVVRRYRLDSAPLIRDVTRGWRTGRAELVMDGQFDLLAHVLQGE